MYLSLRRALFLRNPAGDDITNSSHGSGQFIIVKIRFPIIINYLSEGKNLMMAMAQLNKNPIDSKNWRPQQVLSHISLSTDRFHPTFDS